MITLSRRALLIAGACWCWGVDNCVTANLNELAPAQITFVKGVVAGGANLLIGLAVGGAVPVWSVVGALVVGGFGYGISITLWAREENIGIAISRAPGTASVAPLVATTTAGRPFWAPVSATTTGRSVPSRPRRSVASRRRSSRRSVRSVSR